MEAYIRLYDINERLEDLIEKLQSFELEDKSYNDVLKGPSVYALNDIESKRMWSISDTLIQKYVKDVTSSTYNPFEHLKNTEGYFLYKYSPGDRCVLHVDQDPVKKRDISCVIALNDDFEGGAFEFRSKNEVVSFKIKRNQALMFPSNFLYPHQVLPIITGNRYVVVFWVTL